MSASSNPDNASSQSRRSFLKNAVGAGIVASTANLAAQNGNSPTESFVRSAAPFDATRLPNIVYIHSHDTGRYFQPFGLALPTPNLQHLAEQGVFFRNSFSGAPTCSPSRAALLTGMCAHSSGMLGLAHLGWSLHNYQQVIIHTLKQKGYTSVLAGLQHIAAKPETIGYDILLPHQSVHAADVAPAAAVFIEGKPKLPFFLDVGFFETHRPFPAPTPGDNPAFIAPPDAVPDEPVTRGDMAAFHASIREMDRGVGVVLKALQNAGLAENTLIISTTDHGIAFPDMKCSLRDDGWGVSMIMHGPGIFSRPQLCDAMISQIDVFPTLCEYLGIKKPAWLQGKSFLPVLRGEIPEINEELFAEVTYHASYEPKRAVRTRRWKYVKRFNGRTKAVLPNCDDSPSKDLWLRSGWQKLSNLRQENLYDLVFDPEEKQDLADDPACEKVLAEMRSKLADWMKSTADPLLQGPVPLPSGGWATDPDAISSQRPPRPL